MVARATNTAEKIQRTQVNFRNPDSGMPIPVEHIKPVWVAREVLPPLALRMGTRSTLVIVWLMKCLDRQCWQQRAQFEL